MIERGAVCAMGETSTGRKGNLRPHSEWAFVGRADVVLLHTLNFNPGRREVSFYVSISIHRIFSLSQINGTLLYFLLLLLLLIGISNYTDWDALVSIFITSRRCMRHESKSNVSVVLSPDREWRKGDIICRNVCTHGVCQGALNIVMHCLLTAERNIRDDVRAREIGRFDCVIIAYENLCWWRRV